MHNIEHYTYPENVHRDYVQRELNYYVQNETRGEGGHGLDKDIRWLEKLPVCKDYDQAVRTIEINDKGWYDQLAVRYYDHSSKFNNKKLEWLKEREKDALAAYREKDGIWAKNLKAEFVGCRTCGSRLKREYIQSNCCPLCKHDLRPDSTIKAVESALNRYKKAEAARNSYVCDHAPKTVKWLVKIEYHT